MELKNSHITEYLNWYIAQKNPGYAVFMEGRWGSGKTHAIKKWREGHTNKKDILYVSLYGLEKTTQIDSQLLMSNFTELEGKWSKWGGKIKVAANLLKEGTSQFFEKKYEISLPDLGFGDILSVLDFSGKTIIFDDLERQTIGLEQLMGYVNNFVEHKNAKVIIIGDESKLEQLSIIKEKTIGNTLHFIAEHEDAINIFITNLTSNKIKDLLRSNKDIISDIFEKSMFNNLRLLKQSLCDFERFFDYFQVNLSENPDFQKDILSVFLIFSFEVKSGKIKNIKDELPIILKRYYGDFLDSLEKSPEIKQSILNRYHGFDSIGGVIMNHQIWIQFFEKGIISNDLIEKESNESMYLAKDPEWYKLWRYRELEDEEVFNVFQKAKDDLANNKIENIYEVMHCCSSILYLHSLGIIDLDEAEFIKLGKTNIDRLRKQLTSEFKNQNQADHNSALGYGYHGLELANIKELFDYLESIAKDEKIENYKIQCLEMLHLLKNNDIREIHSLLTNKYFNIPILSYMDSNDFFNAFIAVENKRKMLLIDGLENRFKGKFDSHALELSFLKGLLTKAIEYKTNSSGKTIKLLYVDKLIDFLNYTISIL